MPIVKTLNVVNAKGTYLSYKKGEKLTGLKVKADKGSVKLMSEHKNGICTGLYTSGRFKGESTDNFHLNEFLIVI